jgi:hypothetical protein
LDKLNLLSLCAVACAIASERPDGGGFTIGTGEEKIGDSDTFGKEVDDKDEEAVASEATGRLALGGETITFGRDLDEDAEGTSALSVSTSLNFTRQFRPPQLSQYSSPGIVYLPTR